MSDLQKKPQNINIPNDYIFAINSTFFLTFCKCKPVTIHDGPKIIQKLLMAKLEQSLDVIFNYSGK